jgi:hypothetical protein
MGWWLDLKKEASHAPDGMPAGQPQAFGFKGSESLCDLWRTERHIMNVDT